MIRTKALSASAGAVLWLALAQSLQAAECPSVTVASTNDLSGAAPQQFELAEFQDLAACTLLFSDNPDIADLNERIVGNPQSLAPVAERLPDEPLVVVPYEQIGTYGGILGGLSEAAEVGTSDLLSVRHVNLVRFADDLVTIVPNVARAWSWNDDFTELTFTLRKGHRWSDGKPFTSVDIVFWYDYLTMDKNVVAKPRAQWLTNGEPMTVRGPDDVTVVFTMKAPRPGLLATLATDYAQPFQPRHFLGPFHPQINPKADELAKEAGFETGYDVIQFYYGGSDWKDVPSPYLKDAAKIEALPAAVVPTLESHIVVQESADNRTAVANPYFHMVDTAGNQLPYINEINEMFVADGKARMRKLVSGDVDYKAQSMTLNDVSALQAKQEENGYTIDLRPRVGAPTLAFNLTSEDVAKREIFQKRSFRVAMSHALDRDAINEAAYLGLGTPRQYIAFDPDPSFVTDAQLAFATDHRPETAGRVLNGIGLTDVDGDGWRDLPNGERFVLNIRYASQGATSEIMKLIARQWSAIGVETKIEKISTPAYRAAQTANELDVLVWTKGQPAASIQADNQLFVPPFGTYFGSRTGVLWATFAATDGKFGVEPPSWVADMAEKVAEWQKLTPGGAESDTLGAALAQLQLDEFLFIGTVQAPNPIYHSTRLANFEIPKTWSYEYYRTYPYRAQQWSLSE
ncbi:MAG: ABC transporter substrate-binding protein [Alphaproteobacteria bacterium]